MSAILYWVLFVLSLTGGTPAVDDGPCPAGTTEVVPAGADYSDGVWELADGTLYGVSREEDECIILMTDDLA